MAMFPGREMTDEELLEARSQSSGMQRASTLDALNAMAAAAPQAEPVPPPEPINVPPMLERPMGTIPEALGRPSGEVVHPRDRALIDRFKQFQQTTLPAQKQARMVVPEMLQRMPEVQAPRTAEGMVLDKFGGSMAAYNKWWNSLPQGMKPRSWDQALGMVSSPEALGVPKPAPEIKAQAKVGTDSEIEPQPQAYYEPAGFVGPPSEGAEPFVGPSAPDKKEMAPDDGVRLFDGGVDDGKSLLHPVSGATFRSSTAGRRGGRTHAGDDYAPKRLGDKPPLVAMTDGKVLRVRDMKKYPNAGGNRIEIEYGTGKNRFMVRYFHMDKPAAFKVNGKLLTGDALDGKRIKRGTPLGIMGNTGKGSGVHLHTELYRPDPKTGEYEKTKKGNYAKPHDFEAFLKGGGKLNYAQTLLAKSTVSKKTTRDKHYGHNH